MTPEVEENCILLESEVWAYARFTARLCYSLFDTLQGHITREIYLEDIGEVEL
ncbi:MAG: hypothetical protein FWB90_03945 [Fibromonadales bacterium]|nr:hypothetical protein [Fibromonadales bacterium]